MSTTEEMLLQVTLELIRKSGVREWDDIETQTKISDAALGIVAGLLGITDMALPDSFVVSAGTAKTIKNSVGDAAITLASLANTNGTTTGARQAVTLDLGATWAQRWRLDVDFELAATPTAGAVVELRGSWSNSTGAGRGNTSGTDAAYTGYSSNVNNAVAHLDYLGAHVCTAQATSTVQKSNVGEIFPSGRYLNLVVINRSGAAFHSTDTNQVITLTPLDETVVD